MRPQRVILSAISSLGSNKMRSLLTLLGIVIGVAMVISLMSIGRGVQVSIEQEFTRAGANLLYVSGARGPMLTLGDAYALVDPVAAPHVDAVSPTADTWGDIVFSDGGRTRSIGTSVTGVTPEYRTVRGVSIASGEFIAIPHVTNASDVIVLGASLAAHLFGGRSPLGAIVTFQGRQLRVIGVLESEGGSRFSGTDGMAMLPLTTVTRRYTAQRSIEGEPIVDTIVVHVASVEQMDQTEQDVATILRLRRRITGQGDFEIFNQQELLRSLQESTAIFLVFLGSIAGISLLVGGIGIMNIMLVTVTERTREIGIRKAVGARRRDILMQFVVESVILSLAGGILGLLLGAGMSKGMDLTFFRGEEDFNTVISPDIVVLALGVSAAVGLFFGIYPALRAAMLHPIEALRYE